MNIKHNSNMKFRDIHIAECFKFENSEYDQMYIKILVQDGFDKLKFNAVSLKNGVAISLDDDTEIIAFRNATIHTNG